MQDLETEAIMMKDATEKTKNVTRMEVTADMAAIELLVHMQAIVNSQRASTGEQRAMLSEMIEHWCW